MHPQNTANWLEITFGPGKTEDVLRRLAWNFWEHAHINEIKNGYGRIISGQTLLEWGELAGIKKIVLPHLKKKAYITPCTGGFQLSILTSKIAQKKHQNSIRVDLELDPATRWIFAHEIGHTFFYDKSFDPPMKVHGNSENSEETLCQQFAAELLLPYHRMVDLIPSQLTIESLVVLSKIYGVPLRAVIIRLQDLMILRATCVIINTKIATSWSKYSTFKKPLPKRGIEIFVPPQSSLKITDEYLCLNEVLNRVCTSGTYWNNEYCEQCEDDLIFVEGLRLNKIAPCKACLFLFHEEHPTFTEKLLFD